MLGVFLAGAITASALPALPAQAADVSGLSAKEIAADMGVGWNLGNALDAHDGGSHKKLGSDSETYWGNPEITKELIDTVKDKGFNTIRVPVTWYPHADDNYNIDSAWMKRVKQVVDWCIDEDTYVILNIHHEEWNRPTDANYEAASAELKAFWKQIAAEFEGYDRHLIFEGMNEPRNYNGANEWNGGTDEMRKVVNKLDKDFVDTVRATGGNNKTRCLMIPTYAASSETVAMRALEIPNDDNILVSIHAYTPYNFTMNTGGGATSTFDSTQEKALKQLFTNINSIFLSNDHPVVIGEFSSSNKNNLAERSKWAKCYASQAKSYGIPIVLWDNNAPNDTQNNGEGHGYLNRSTLKWYSSSEDVVDTLISTYYGAQKPDPKPAPTDEEGELIYKGSLSAEGWTPSSAVPFDFTTMKEGSQIAVKKDMSGVAPTLIIQDKDPYKVWAKVAPNAISGDMVYYTYSDIVAAYADAYKSAYGKAPESTLYNAFQLFISAENNGTAGASEVYYIPPAKNAPAKPDISECRISLSEKSYVYDGNEHKPTVTVTYKDKTLHEGTDYTVDYKSGKEVGDYYITVKGSGEYTGSTKVKFVIDPADISGYRLGDVNFDEKINVVDISLIASHIKGISTLNENRRKAADVNKDGKINAADITKIAAHIKGIKTMPKEYIG